MSQPLKSRFRQPGPANASAEAHLRLILQTGM